MPIDNIEKIKPLLNFINKGDMYTVYVMLRKKDMTTDKANHQSVRVIKAYYIYSMDKLDERYEEIKSLCEHFKARAYIAINRVNDSDIGFAMIIAIVEALKHIGSAKFNYIFDKVVGSLPSLDKRWLLDVDEEQLQHLHLYKHILSLVRPDNTDKVITQIPSKSGVHLITNRFDVAQFTEYCKQYNLPIIDIQKTNPTCLYIPDSLLIQT